MMCKNPRLTIWCPEHEEDDRITDVGHWVRIPFIVVEFPERAGVYVFADGYFNVWYVGECGGGRLNDEALEAVERCKSTNATQAIWFETGSKQAAKTLQDDWIDFYDPPNNGIEIGCEDE